MIKYPPTKNTLVPCSFTCKFHHSRRSNTSLHILTENRGGGWEHLNLFYEARVLKLDKDLTKQNYSMVVLMNRGAENISRLNLMTSIKDNKPFSCLTDGINS